MTDPRGSDHPRPAAQRRSELGYRSRLERRTTKRKERRRKALVKFWYVAIPVVAVVAAIVALAVVFGGDDDTGLAPDPADAVTAPVSQSQPGCGLLVIEQDDIVPVVVLIHPRELGGVVLGMPGITLLKTATGFQTIVEVYASGEGGVVERALSEALDVTVDVVASAEWADLRQGVAALAGAGPAVGTTGAGDLPPEKLAAGPGEVDLVAQAEVVAQAVLRLCAAINSEEGATVWGGLELGGDSSGLVDLLAAEALSMSVGGWTALAVSGEVREGEGFAYLEPDVQGAKAILAGTVEEVVVSLELQNGSGAIGVTEEAGKLLESLGYALLPYRNAADFPDVVQTRISFSPGEAAAAERVRDLLGVGDMSEDEALESGRIVVVLGKDFTPPPSGTGSEE